MYIHSFQGILVCLILKLLSRYLNKSKKNTTSLSFCLFFFNLGKNTGTISAGVVINSDFKVVRSWLPGPILWAKLRSVKEFKVWLIYSVSGCLILVPNPSGGVD